MTQGVESSSTSPKVMGSILQFFLFLINSGLQLTFAPIGPFSLFHCGHISHTGINTVHILHTLCVFWKYTFQRKWSRLTRVDLWRRDLCRRGAMQECFLSPEWSLTMLHAKRLEHSGSASVREAN